MAPVSAPAEYITPSASFFKPALHCCQCLHAAVLVRKGLSGYSSHYCLLNRVMAVKALPVPPSSPPCLRGQLTACFMSWQRRASMPGHGFIHTPPLPPSSSPTPSSPSVLRPRSRTDGWAAADCHLLVHVCSAYLSRL